MEQTKETHDQYYEMAHAPVGRVISKLAVPTIISMLVTFLPWPSSRHCPL